MITSDHTTKRCTKCGNEYPLTDEFWPKRTNGKFRADCKECRKIWRKQYYQDNSERAIEYSKQWAKDNPDKRIVVESRYRKVRADRRKVSNRHWFIKNRKRKYLLDSRYRVRKLNSEGSHTIGEVMTLFREQEGYCYHCGTDLIPTGYHRDHWIPLTKGGSDFIDNIRLLCPHCNLSKGNKLPHEWSDRYR